MPYNGPKIPDPGPPLLGKARTEDRDTDGTSLVFPPGHDPQPDEIWPGNVEAPADEIHIATGEGYRPIAQNEERRDG